MCPRPASVINIYLFLLLIFLVEQVGVRPRVEHDEDELRVVLLPDEQPVRLDVALPLALTVAVKFMRLIFYRQLALNGKNADGSAQLLHIIASPLT